MSLVVYAYSSFVADWGAGPQIVKDFEAQCQCKVKLVSAGNGADMVSKLKLEGAKSKADVALGFDQTLLPKMREQGWKDFTKFDYGPFAFIYNSEVTKNPPQSLNDLLDPQWKNKILIQDPRFSSVGLGFLTWVVMTKGEDSWEYLKKLRPQIKAVPVSWDMAYGMFKKGQGELVMSYWTSPVYHILEEKTEKYRAANFREGHPVQEEFVAVSPYSKNKKLAQEFVDFLLGPGAQKIIAEKNYMYPANPKAPLPEVYKKIGEPKLLPGIPDSKVSQVDDWIKKWRTVFK